MVTSRIPTPCEAKNVLKRITQDQKDGYRNFYDLPRSFQCEVRIITPSRIIERGLEAVKNYLIKHL